MTLPIPSIHCNQCSLPSFPPCSDGVAVGHFWKVLREGERASEPVGSVRYGRSPVYFTTGSDSAAGFFRGIVFMTSAEHVCEAEMKGKLTLLLVMT